MVVVNIRAKLIAKQTDIFDYTTYAFQNIDTGEYVLCTRFPNWEHSIIEIGEEGILQFKEVIAGEDKWFNGTNMIPGESSISFEEIVKERIFENINKTNFSTKKNIEHDFIWIFEQMF